MLVIGIMGIVVVLMAIQFKSIKPEYGIMISVVGCTFIFLYSLVRVNEIVEMVERLAGITSISREYIKIILKITGVTFISEIASDIAKDCGYQAVANQVQIFGKLSVLVISFPVFTEKNFFPIREGVLKVPVIKYGFYSSLFQCKGRGSYYYGCAIDT